MCVSPNTYFKQSYCRPFRACSFDVPLKQTPGMVSPLLPIGEVAREFGELSVYPNGPRARFSDSKGIVYWLGKPGAINGPLKARLRKSHSTIQMPLARLKID